MKLNQANTTLYDVFFNFLIRYLKAASPFHKYVVESNKSLFALENLTPLHISVSQNNYTLTSMLLSRAYELLHCSADNLSPGFEPPMLFPHECWGRDGCQHRFSDTCWREQKYKQLKLCRLNPFDRAFHNSTTTLTGTAPIESLLLLAARGGGNIERVKNLTKIRL